jgi:hypothetical protein
MRPMTVTSARHPLFASPSGGAPDRDPHPWRRRVLLGGLFVGVTAVMVRPTWHSLDRTVPNLGDPVLYIWGLSWGVHGLLTQPLHVFGANIFWPHPLTWAYTDSLLVLVPSFGLVRLFGGSWALALNLTMLALLVVSQASTYLLAHWLTGRRDAAVLAAIAFSFSSFVFVHFGHTQLLLLGLFPLCFYLLFRTLEERSLGWSALLGVANVAMLTGALYYAAIYGVCVACIIVGWLSLHRRDLTRRLLHCFLVVGAITLLAVPALVPYVRLDQERALVPQWGLKAADLVTVSPRSVLYPGLDHAANKRADRTEHTFFPGFSTALLALVGMGALVVRRRRRVVDLLPPDGALAAPGATAVDADAASNPDDPVATGRREYVWLLAAAGGASVVLALGPEVHGVTMPFRLFHDYVPGFKGIRVASRLAIPAMLTGTLLAAVGFSWLTRRLRARAASLLAVVVGGLMLLEFGGPVYRVELPTDRATLAVYHELNRRPEGAVVELPVADIRNGGVEWAILEAPRMVYSTIDWHDRFNGYSGGWPDDYVPQLASLNSFPSRDALDTARRLKLRYVVLHTGPYAGFPQYTDAQANAIVAALPTDATATRYGNSWLIDLGETLR